MKNDIIHGYKDLIVWQRSMELVVAVYQLTDDFPRQEIYGLISQMRRAAVSIPSNIAEGFGRQGYKEKIQFYYLAQGSLIELKNQLLAAKDIGYIEKDDFNRIAEQANKTHQLLQGIIKSSKSILKS